MQSQTHWKQFLNCVGRLLAKHLHNLVIIDQKNLDQNIFALFCQGLTGYLKNFVNRTILFFLQFLKVGPRQQNTYCLSFRIKNVRIGDTLIKNVELYPNTLVGNNRTKEWQSSTYQCTYCVNHKVDKIKKWFSVQCTAQRQRLCMYLGKYALCSVVGQVYYTCQLYDDTQTSNNHRTMCENRLVFDQPCYKTNLCQRFNRYMT